MKHKKILIAALVFPLLCLVFLAGSKAYVSSIGKEFTLPVTGFDPRDLLSGHYIVYQIAFDIDDLCAENSEPEAVCLVEGGDHYASHSALACDYPLRGVCQYGRFQTGLERFYIPQSEAMRLDAAVRKGEGSIVLSVTPSGANVVKKLLVNGQSWQAEES
ncbi:GDYXXLXY domain-containing protein [Simiduia curdlanivorans]|uniref:GDYXXLXY domain-containing protein n=1 Tax=Simiduia curdlanivorans TaxID=1492769 RepID=A0ABV8V4C0_9GAMM|nr:GDYXXLXY domain-containing protein [Simiduia curdlanivorans]MDN3637351.1 GDYXXLXY domain-containing protein [Simiduia curdlanivorans]